MRLFRDFDISFGADNFVACGGDLAPSSETWTRPSSLTLFWRPCPDLHIDAKVVFAALKLRSGVLDQS